MTESIPSRYFPAYPEDGAPEAGIQAFITNFYQLSDDPAQNERWVSSFTDDAHVHIAADKADGSQGIRELRARMWSVIKERKHTVLKVFPANFASRVECMLIGEATFLTKDGKTLQMSWTGHGVLRKEEGAWKFASYRVWAQME